MKISGVSVIICCYNSANRIERTLQHLQRQVIADTLSWEIILVDNNSTDRTALIAKKCWELLPVTTLKIIQETAPGLIHARKAGASNAVFDILSFIDDDNFVEEHWVDKVYAIFTAHSDLGACGGSSNAIFEKLEPFWFSTFKHSFAIGKQQEHSGYVTSKRGFLWGAGLSVLKTAWYDLINCAFKFRLTGRKGKHLLAGEDTELCLALQLRGWKLWYQDDLHFDHLMPEGRMNVNYLLSMYSGFGKAALIIRIYRTALKFDVQKPLLKDAMYLFFACISGVVKCIFLTGINKIVAKSILYYNWTYLQTLFTLRGQYKSILAETFALKKT